MIPRRLRGQPILVLGLLLAGWISVRALVWQSPFPQLQDALLRDMPQIAAQQERPDGQVDAENSSPLSAERSIAPTAARRALAAAPAIPSSLAWEQLAAPPLPGDEAQPLRKADVAAAHQLLWLAAMSHLPVPPSISTRLAAGTEPGEAKQPHALRRPDRWSLDGWVFARQKSGAGLAAQGREPTYGTSQAAAVLRYRLAPESAHDPHAYGRIYKALVAEGESEGALGLSARPTKAVPVRLHAELRGTRFVNSSELRPAVFATTEFPAVALPGGTKAETYLQAGIVGGANATGFVDGEAHVMRPVKEYRTGRISLGAGAWGGAQKDAARFDLGPSMRVDVMLADTPARLSLDWRERVAGDADPKSGLAVTLSTGF